MKGKKPTTLLSEEHAEVLRKLDDLERLIGRLEEREEATEGLKALAAFFAADFWVHFTKEEEGLFPEMDKFLPRNTGPIGAMLIEHEHLRKTNSHLQAELAQYFSGSSSTETVSSIRRYGTDFISGLRDHIAKEDNILFRIADAHLTETQDAAILEKFDQIAPAAV